MTRSDIVQFSRGFLIGVSAFIALVVCTYAPSTFITPPGSGNPQHLRSAGATVDLNLLSDGHEATHTASSVFSAGSVLTLAALAAVGLRRRERSNTAGSTQSAFKVIPQTSVVTRKALDQSSRYADLSLTEEGLIKNGKHVLVAYIMKPKAGYDYLATAAHFAAESSTGTNVNVCTTDDFTKSVDA
eukprot:CAMPEP_0170592552 /NCGR_PEP_ID=MMETSP0224-20130122/12983_1 /TAXON_ID=285029 /ORGANISM="Togula jolla, Strain CCCM 725" /LENGTH=185 /DNA_ID=CAMNT_0010916461 /DNA_START=46 /DNA_END=599 /DNA_ORIENTATION=+